MSEEEILDFTKLNLEDFNIKCDRLKIEAWQSSNNKYSVYLGKVCPISLLDYFERCGDHFTKSFILALQQRAKLKGDL